MLATVFGATAVAAQTDSDGDDDLGAELEAAIDEYNEDPGVPNPAVETLLRGETLNVHVEDDGSEAVYSFRVNDDLEIVEFEEEARDDATIELYMDRSTAEEISESDNVASAFVDAIESDQIEVECNGIAAQVKCAPIEAAQST